MTAIQIQMAAGNVLVINMYNHITHADSISHVLQTMRARARARGSAVGTENTIWLGDFNRHHPVWDKAQNSHLFMRAKLDKGQYLSVNELDLHMVLPKDLPTLQAMATGNHMRPNNVFMSEVLHNMLVKCMSPGGATR